ncbi:tripartite tricarboxylate transporter TctB family protein [Salinicola sp. JS01]|uniref:tripartite tricarboxylate transporter TctB family protein n=1 Tax=Salinicola sp. JS01 TaxID=3050071 RepID=UPI00255B9212|nr:tripartite tricarboxylate transporter TctB family protein [Salinicola sp. JS01]WIX33421.1 tripartite tricarboxylate transporter TctB family protein [Salinicola sp. JS01]
MSHPPSLKAGERAFNLLLLLLSGGVFYEAYRISGFELPNSAGAFPLLLGAIMIVTMLSILLGQRHHSRPAAGGAFGELRQFLATHFPLPVVLFSLLAVGYLLALPALGFITATALFLLIAQLCLRRGHWISAVLVTVLITAVIYALFTLLFQVYLP